ncbi:hypothetical protein GCM10027168_44650 [Streptomyces capparidis]
MTAITPSAAKSTRPRPGSPAARAAAAAIRRIGHRRHRPAGRAAHFTCSPCAVAWAGPEADCWSCGRPASTEHGHRGAALQILLHHTGPTAEAVQR